MRLEECMKLKEGDTVRFKDSYGWWREGSFLRIVEATKLGRMYASDLFSKSYDWRKAFDNGRKVKEAVIEYLDDNGRKQTAYVNPRLVVRGL